MLAEVATVVRWRRNFTTGIGRRHPGLAWLTVGVMTFLPHGAAHAASDVMLAAVALGRLHVMGTTDKPNTPVTLDRRFHTTSDKNGTFSFEEIYHPPTCIVGVDIDATVYRAVVSNCTQEATYGPLPFVGAAFPRFVAPGRSAEKVQRTPQAAHIVPVKPKPVPEPPRPTGRYAPTPLPPPERILLDE